jgi:hypothetical protein
MVPTSRENTLIRPRVSYYQLDTEINKLVNTTQINLVHLSIKIIFSSVP